MEHCARLQWLQVGWEGCVRDYGPVPQQQMGQGRNWCRYPVGKLLLSNSEPKLAEHGIHFAPTPHLEYWQRI